MTATPGAQLPIRSVPNLRDLGGWPTASGGRVRLGVVYRSAALDQLAGADVAALADLGVVSIYDLRTEAERVALPDIMPQGAQVIPLDVLADMSSAAPAELAQGFGDPAAVAAGLGDGKAAALMLEAYHQILVSESARTAYRALFADLADPGRRPSLFHCATGKDRTGWAAASLLLLLGVSIDDVMTEYLLTNEQLAPALAPIYERFAAAGGDPAVLRPLLGVESAYLETALAEMRSRYGTVEAYFEDGLGLDADVLTALRTALIEERR